jgi:hypothetical protein
VGVKNILSPNWSPCRIEPLTDLGLAGQWLLACVSAVGSVTLEGWLLAGLLLLLSNRVVSCLQTYSNSKRTSQYLGAVTNDSGYVSAVDSSSCQLKLLLLFCQLGNSSSPGLAHAAALSAAQP